MTVRPIVMLGDPRLRLKGETVDSFGKFLHGLLDDLTATMRDAPGVGLAAPQLGEPLRACVVEVENHLYELVNPQIVRDRRRRSRPRGLPLDPRLRRLRHAPRAGVGRRPEPDRQEVQGLGVRPAGPGAPARAGPPRRQAVHRLPRLDGRAHRRRPGRRGRGRGGPRARRARSRDRAAAGRGSRPDGLPGQRRVRRPEPARARRARRPSSSSAIVTAPPRPAGRRAARRALARPRRRRRARPDALRGCGTRRPSPTILDLEPGARRARRLRPDRAARRSWTCRSGR